MTFKAFIVLSLLLAGLVTASTGGVFTTAAEAGPSCSACN
jgi:hypothetical protein